MKKQENWEEKISTFFIHKAEVSYDHWYFVRPLLFQGSCTCRERLLPVSCILSFPLVSAWNARLTSPFLVSSGCRCGSRSLCLLELCVRLRLSRSDDLLHTTLASPLPKRSSPLSKLARDERLAPVRASHPPAWSRDLRLSRTSREIRQHRLSPPSSLLEKLTPVSPDFTLGEDH